LSHFVIAAIFEDAFGAASWALFLRAAREDVLGAIGAVRALMNIVHQPRTLLVLGLNAGMSTAAGTDELVEITTDACVHPGPRRTPFQCQFFGSFF